jgi:very-short-patch-repair endonuclease
VLQKLRETTPNRNDWLPVFQLEYINRCIEERETKIGLFNVDGHELNTLSQLQAEIRAAQKDKILSYWIDIRRKSIRNYNKTSNIHWLYNYRRNKIYGKANALRKIVAKDFDLFSNIFPVLLVNPTVCSSLLPLEKGIFDLVIFDEASQLRLEDTFAAFYRGKTKVISGDKQQMPPSSYFSTDIILEALEEIVEEETTTNQNFKEEHPLFLAESESLLAFGNNLNMEETNVSYLDFHYRSKHPHLIDISNAAFYGKRLVPLPATYDYQPIRFIAVNGIYKDANNIDEAKKIIAIIRTEIQPNEAGEYPTLGIATFNLKQRNIIKNTIYSETVSDVDFRLKMEAIGKEESWFVKNLENVQGDERDIIIISTTFGINGNGRFIQNFGPINNYEKGYKLLNVIITRAKKQLYVLTSIPEEKYTKYQDELLKKGNKGKAIFYAYLDYCKAVEEGDEKRRQTILRLVARNSDDLLHYELPQEVELPPFEQEIFRYLSDYVQPQFLEKQYPLGGYRIDFVIKDKENNAVIAIECDGTDWHKTEEAYIYDIHRQNIIEGMGLKYHRIWARNWFPNPDYTAVSLVAMIANTMPFVMEKIKTSDYSDVIDSVLSKLSEKNEN